jgi:hypothetical protein
LTARIIYRFDDRIRRLGGSGPMSDGRLCRLRNGIAAVRAPAVIAAILLSYCSAADAVEPPSEHCRAASKTEYESAKKQFLLRNRFGAYVRTGRIWHRHYWYCQL